MATAMRARGGRSYGGQTPEQRDEERRRRLIAAAIELYGGQGYHATSITQVCSRANVATRNFYELFGSSEALLLAAYDEVIAEQMERVGMALSRAPESLHAKVEAGILAASELWRDERRARLAQQEVLGVSPAVERSRTRVLDAFARLIAEQASGLGGSSLDDEQLLVTGHVLGGGLNEAFLAWRLRPPDARPPLEEVAQRVARVFIATLEGLS